jgi:hypothetical protein
MQSLANSLIELSLTTREPRWPLAMGVNAGKLVKWPPNLEVAAAAFCVLFTHTRQGGSG